MYVISLNLHRTKCTAISTSLQKSTECTRWRQSGTGYTYFKQVRIDSDLIKYLFLGKSQITQLHGSGR